MSYAPGHDGPPVSELQAIDTDAGTLCCPLSNGIWTRDRYYADRWPDDPSPDCYVWTCPCGKPWKGDTL